MNKALYLGAIAALLIAILPLPYGYYLLLRIFMCGMFSYLACNSFKSGRSGLGWILGCVAVVYNPFVPLHLGKAVWSVVNLMTLGILVYVNAKGTNKITIND
jgi:hypothetical protein